MLGAPANLGDADEILLGEDGVVEGKQCGSLPLREGVGEQGAGRVGAAVEAERDGGGAGVVGVLYELLQDGGSRRVVEQNLADAPRQINRLPEVFQKNRFRRRRHCYRRVSFYRLCIGGFDFDSVLSCRERERERVILLISLASDTRISRLFSIVVGVSLSRDFERCLRVFTFSTFVRWLRDYVYP